MDPAHPIQNSKHDVFERISFARHLAGFLVLDKSDPSIVIGVEGEADRPFSRRQRLLPGGRHTIATFRWKLVQIAGRIVHHVGQVVLKLAAGTDLLALAHGIRRRCYEESLLTS